MSEASEQPGVPDESAASGSTREVATLFLKLGCIAFGGPAAHIALMRDEVVRRRHWITDQEFLDYLGAANLIPGPSSTELAIFLGYRRIGWVGLILAGALFILPAMLLVLGIAWLYVRYGTTPQATWLLYGIKPVIVAVIVQALWGLGRTAIKSPLLGVLGAAVLALYILGANPMALLIGSGFLILLIQGRNRLWIRPSALLLLPGGGLGMLTGAARVDAAAPISLGLIFLAFLKLGVVVFGSGYVILAFLRSELVSGLHWLTDEQILDAVAVGQVTPGPVYTTATFLGYVLGGLPGAVLATVGIFLPGFVLVALIYPLVPRVRGSSWARSFLDGVNVAAIGLMAGVTWDLGRASVVDGITLALALAAVLLLIRFRVSSAWLVAAGGAAGIGARLLGV